MRTALGFVARGLGYLVLGTLALGVSCAVLGGLAVVVGKYVIVTV